MAQDGFTPWETYWTSKTLLTTERGEFNIDSTSPPTPFVMLCIHGAGHSGLSFSLLCQEISSTCQVFAPDLRCHGDTPGDPSTDLTIENLVADIVAIGRAIVPEDSRLFLVGHSLGGSIAARAAHVLKPAATFVIDTIEGIAIAAMPGMSHILSVRPQTFATAKAAIRYVASSGEMNSETSAAISTAGRVSLQDGVWKWRTNILPSQDYWTAWFRGFADIFVRAPTYKVLILPDIDRLDKPFLIGHMSGKFQLEIIHGTHHCMHEDAPQDIARIIRNLIERLTAAVPHWN
jgi:protein phosphatase methylesterase 1